MGKNIDKLAELAREIVFSVSEEPMDKSELDAVMKRWHLTVSCVCAITGKAYDTIRGNLNGRVKIRPETAKRMRQLDKAMSLIAEK